MSEEDTPLDILVHDVRSKCATLSDAATALLGAAPEGRRRLLRLMIAQAREVAERIAAFEQGR